MTDSSGMSLLERLSFALRGEPLARDQILAELRGAEGLDAQSLAMVEGVFRIADMSVRQVMVPRSKMVVLRRDAELEVMLDTVVQSAHSRYPVIGEDRDEVVGILLAKDLLAYLYRPGTDGRGAPKFVLRDVLRPAIFIPESKRLNVLLSEFRHNRNHMAIVVDEYGGVAGLVTIEDVLEEIVGEIEDEHDQEEGGLIERLDDRAYGVDALTSLEAFDEAFGSSFSGEGSDTIGGLVAARSGRVPQVGDEVSCGDFLFTVLEGDARRVRRLRVERRGG